MNRHTVSSDMKRAFTGRGFFIGVSGMVLVIALSALENIMEVMRSPAPLQKGYHAQFIADALSSDALTLALPVLCALPYTTAFVDDMKSGFIKQYLHRSGTGPYIRGKLLACGCAGGLVLFTGIMLAYGLSALLFMPMELAAGQAAIAQPSFAQVLLTAALISCSGAFWSLTGFTLAALTMNRYMAYASPFILYYVLIILHERYFAGLYMLYPREWLFPSAAWVLGDFGVILLLAALTAILCLSFVLIAQRRLGHV